MPERNLFSLNEQQKKGIEQPLAPVLVLAGPGTGKTRLLISRIARLITTEGINPANILALTFTNKAASELRIRLISLIGQQGEEVFAGTFHSFALKILRKYYNRIGLSEFFSVCGQDYQEHLLKHVCTPYINENIDAKINGMLLSFSNHILKGKPLTSFGRDRFEEYRAHLKKHRMIDFDQTILLCRDLLLQNPDILSQYQFLYPAILIDEFQDTDPIQYEIIKLLAQKHRNIFVVADDDQSIYSWRGAQPENIKKFMQDFGVQEPVFLEVNYRNGGQILSSANQIIQKTNRIEPGKQVRAIEGSADSVEIQLFLNEQDEIAFILQKINYWIEQSFNYKDIAIIYPFHKIGQTLEQPIINQQIPYQMAQGKSLMSQPLIRNIILYLRLIRDVDDHVALEELTMSVLGQTLYTIIKETARKNKIKFRQSLYNYYRDQSKRLSFDLNMKMKAFIGHIANLVNLKNFYTFEQLVEEIYSYAEQGESLFLKRYVDELEGYSIFKNQTDMHLKDSDKKQIYVYHTDRRVAFLASVLVTSVLEQEVQVYEPKDALPKGDDSILLEIEPLADKWDGTSRLTLYSNNTPTRKGSLSTLFKYLQTASTMQNYSPFDRFVVLDLETTDKDTDSCGIVEFAAVRVVEGKIEAELHSLINPKKKISQSAQQIHHITFDQIRNSPTIEEFWGEIINFTGNDVLIAHNGYSFDFAILDRFSKEIKGSRLANARLDSLTIARNLYPGATNSIDALIDRYNLVSNERHRALDDVKILVEIFQKLQSRRLEISRKLSLQRFLDIVALGNFIENKITAKEDRIFFISGARKLQSAYSEIRTKYSDLMGSDDAQLRRDIHDKLQQLNPEAGDYKKQEHLIERINQLASQYNSLPVDQAIANFLTYISLNTAQDQLENINAVSLLTYHAAKGLEFEKVILMGLEKNNMPGFHALREDLDDDRPLNLKMEEQRRLFYVGITRARSEVILTAVKNRGGWEHQSSPFLKDLKVPFYIKSN